MKKLIFIVENFFIKRDFDRFGIQFFINNKIDVEVWDITEFCNKNFHNLIRPTDEVKGNYIKKLKNSQDIKNAFKNLKGESLFAVFLNLNINVLLVFRLLSKYKINYFFHNKASIFSNPNWIKRSFPKKVKAFLSKDRRSIIEYFQNMFLRIFPQKLFGISDVPICFKDCKAADTSISLNKKLIGKNTKIILSHHRDYDLYLKYKNNDGEKYKSDAVLLDQNFGFHNDLVRTGEFMDPKKWYESLKVFFDFLKNKYSINITICAHPRSNGEINSFISDYPIIKNKTAQLVKNCSFVICQSSTAINFAALFKKPMIFLYNHIAIKNKKTKKNHAAEVDFFASTFNKRPISIENLKDFNLKNEIKIDENSYDRFIAKHIKSWGPDKMVHEMIMNLL